MNSRCVMKIIIRLSAILHLYLMAVMIWGYHKSQAPPPGHYTKPQVQGSIFLDTRTQTRTHARVTAQLSNFRPLEQTGAGNSKVSTMATPNIFSPYGLEALINNTCANENCFIDFIPIWQKMGLEHDREGVFDGFTPAYSRWRAQLFDANNSHARLRQAVVAISSDGGASRRYVIFKRESYS